MENPTELGSVVVELKEILSEFECCILSEMLTDCNTALENSADRKALWQIKDRGERSLQTTQGMVHFTHTRFIQKETGETAYLLDDTMRLELPDLVEWNEKWKKEIDDLVGKSDLYITQDDLLFDELENKLQYVPDNEFNDKLRQKDTDEAVLTWAKTGNYDRGQPLSYAEIIQGQAQSELINWIWANNKELLMLADCHFIGNVWDYLVIYHIEVFKPYLCDIVDLYTEQDFIKARKKSELELIELYFLESMYTMSQKN